MTTKEARELVNGPMWEMVRNRFLATGEFAVYPPGDLRRLEYLDPATRKMVALWTEAIGKADEWKKIVDGARVRELKERYPGIYPDVFRYQAYFAKYKDSPGCEDAVKLLLKLKFPEAYELCCC